jgi:hypothetical protein
MSGHMITIPNDRRPVAAASGVMVARPSVREVLEGDRRGRVRASDCGRHSIRELVCMAAGHHLVLRRLAATAGG